MTSYSINGLTILRDNGGLLVLQCGNQLCGSVFQSSDPKEPLEEFFLRASLRGWRREPMKTGRILCGSCGARS